MSRQRILEWERRWALPAALCAFGGAALFIVSTVVAQNGVSTVSTNSEFLREFEDARSAMLGAAVLNAAALFLLAPVLYYLFQAASARSPVMRRALVGVVVAGPLFFGLANILQYIALSGAASDFASPGGGAGVPIGEYARDLIQGQTTYGFAQGFSLAGLLALVIGTIYTALWSMRTGLLTRFFATLGMALGASLILLAQAFSLLALMLWSVWLGLIFISRVPGGRPRAWDAGEAIPWPKPGQVLEEESERDVEGDATELFDDAGSNGDAGSNDGENPNAARRERAKRRKRKRRQ